MHHRSRRREQEEQQQEQQEEEQQQKQEQPQQHQQDDLPTSSGRSRNMRISPVSFFLAFVASTGVLTIIRSTNMSLLSRRVDAVIVNDGDDEDKGQSSGGGRRRRRRRHDLHGHHRHHGGHHFPSTELHWELDDKLDVRYSSTERNIPQSSSVSFMFDGASVNRGPASFPQQLLHIKSTKQRSSTTNEPVPDFQHKGIVKIGRENKKKFLRMKETPSTVKYRIDDNHEGWIEDERLVVEIHDPTMLLMWPSSVTKISDREKKNNLSDIDDSDKEQGEEKNDNSENIHTTTTATVTTITTKTTTNSLCHLLSEMTIRKDLDEQVTDERGLLPAFLNMTIDCTQLIKAPSTTTNKLRTSHEEEGKLVASLYTARMIAAKGRVDFQFMCDTTAGATTEATSDGAESEIRQQRQRLQSLQEEHVFVWFGGYQSSPTPHNPWPHGGNEMSPPAESEICQTPVNYETVPLDRMAYKIRDDVRQMVVTLVGSDPYLGRIHPLVPLDATPLLSSSISNDVELPYDDMVIYMPTCTYVGEEATELLISSTETWMKHFKYYFERQIENKNENSKIQSVGIIRFSDETRSDNNNDNNNDNKVAAKQRNEEACNILENDLRNYIQQSIRGVKISDRSYDTIPKSYARLVISRYVFIPSNNLLALFAGIGSFGEVFVIPQSSSSSPTAKDLEWVPRIPSMKEFKNFHIFADMI
mmetsp:Transcript_18809/g.45443  ORF Transcript_18809/g.45443 Transcript_18809/m.45443 type:complete len:700 (+) Transcript_18809:133-2232(+)